jgi:hypothetical protein
MLQAVAEPERIRKAVADGTATEKERASHEKRERRREEYRKMCELIPPNVLYNGPMTWKALHASFGPGSGSD